MTFCPECGKPVAATAKFSRNCGASQLDDAPSPNMPATAPVAAPATSPVTPVPAPVPVHATPVQPPQVPPPVTAPPVAQTLCGSCQSPLLPSEKFCGICGARAEQAVPASPSPATPVHTPVPAPAAVPIPPLVGSPVPVMGSPSVLTCNSCGNVIKPGDKYCSKCLAIVRDNPPPAASSLAAVPAPSPVQPSPAPGACVCASCGSPITGKEKFCGICGAPVVATRVPAPAQPQPHPVSKTCNACGAPLSETTKFCGGCGVPVGATFRPAEVVPPTSCAGAAFAGAPYGEQVLGVIGNARKMKLLGASWDTYALVVTDRRLIMAQLTADLLNAAYREAAEKAKAEGKGFLEPVAHQMSVAFQYCQRYETRLPEIALGETKGNRAVENVRSTAVDMKDKSTQSDSLEYHEFILTFQSADGKFEFHIGEDDRFITILRTAYGDKVHMPFGYFRAGAVRIKLF